MVKIMTRSGTESVELDELFSNPEYNKTADHLIGLIRDRLVREKNEEPTREKLLKIANKILESRL